MNPIEEKKLRQNIRHLIKHVKQKRENNSLNEEKRLRGIIRAMFDGELKVLQEEERFRTIVQQMIQHEKRLLSEANTPDNDPTPNKSTGINVLEDLLKKIIPVLETDFKLLTTDPEQRKSFRAHVISAVVNALTPAIANDEAEGVEEVEVQLEEDIDIDIGDDDETTAMDDEKFIDIRTDAEKSAEETEEEDPRADFGAGLEDKDTTGRNMAYGSFKKIESSIIDSYELLGNAEDQELFYDYLVANLKLYFDKFEDELAGQIEEPTNQAYDTAKAGETGMEGAEEVPTEGGEEEELEFEL